MGSFHRLQNVYKGEQQQRCSCIAMPWGALDSKQEMEVLPFGLRANGKPKAKKA
jgi:hypothetical protein